MIESCAGCTHSRIKWVNEVDDDEYPMHGIDYQYVCALTEQVVKDICDKFDTPF